MTTQVPPIPDGADAKVSLWQETVQCQRFTLLPAPRPPNRPGIQYNNSVILILICACQSRAVKANVRATELICRRHFQRGFSLPDTEKGGEVVRWVLGREVRW